MAWLHTWAGLLLGWLLFAIFLTGTTAYFQQEITRWMQPEVKVTAAPAQAAQAATEFLSGKAPGADSWFVELPDKRGILTQVYWFKPTASPQDGSARLDGMGREITARATQGGFFLYRFHFDLHYLPVWLSRYLVGIAAMFMLVAILSGIVTHKKIFVDFFTLRFGKGQRSWLDAHAVTAVFALPFYLMITYTGLVTLATTYMPWGITANYSNPATYFAQAFPADDQVARSGRAAPLAPLAPIVTRAAAHWGGQVGWLRVVNPGDARARVIAGRSSGDAIGARDTLAFDGVSGRLLSVAPPGGGATAAASTMIGLHAGRYAGVGLRWLYFLSGIMGTAMVATGLVLWTSKRRRKLADANRPHLGFFLVERLNIAVVAGLPAGLAAYFLANRLLPLTLDDRAAAEVNALFITWGAILAWALARPARQAWPEALAIAAAGFGLVVPTDMLTTDRGLFVSLLTGDWLFVAFDSVMLAAAVVFTTVAWKLWRRNARPGIAPSRARALEFAR